jgi:hypothetical protein
MEFPAKLLTTNTTASFQCQLKRGQPEKGHKKYTAEEKRLARSLINKRYNEKNNRSVNERDKLQNLSNIILKLIANINDLSTHILNQGGSTTPVAETPSNPINLEAALLDHVKLRLNLPELLQLPEEVFKYLQRARFTVIPRLDQQKNKKRKVDEISMEHGFIKNRDLMRSIIPSHRVHFDQNTKEPIDEKASKFAKDIAELQSKVKLLEEANAGMMEKLKKQQEQVNCLIHHIIVPLY